MSTSHSLGDLSKWPLLQNKIKRDPGGYVDEFSRALLHFRSSLDLFRLKPNADDRELPALLSFVSNVAPCYAKRADVQSLGPELMTVLEAHADALSPSIRMSLVQALILLRNRGLAPHVEVLGLFFKLFKTHDRPLRRYLHEHIVGEIKSVNIKRKNHTLNRQLQNFMYSMLSDDNALAARHSLDVMVELYRRQVWNDAKTVNVIATGAFHKSGHMVTVALRFLLGRDVDDDDDDDDDDDNEDMAPVDPEVKRARVRLLADTRKLALNSQNGTKANAKKRKYLRAQKALTRTRAGSGGARGQFSPIALLNDPQGFAERLLSGLRASTANFELRLLMMATVSQLIASHQLLVLNYYPWLQKYVQPHQAQVSQILAYAAQACHELVPPDALEPVIRAIVNHFVSDRSRPEVIAIGINTLREICVRVPTALDETLLHDLVQYRKDRDKNVVAAARSLIGVYREKFPELLHKRDRGKAASIQLGAGGGDAGLARRPAAYGASQVATGVAGVELLAADDERIARGERSAVDSASDDDEAAGSSESDGSLDSDIDDDEIDNALNIEGDGDDDDGEGEGEGEDESDDGEEGDDDDDDDDDEADADADGEAADGAPSPRAPASAAQRIDVSRLLTDEDFARLRKLKEAHLKAQLAVGNKRARAGEEEELHRDALRSNLLREEAIDPTDLEGVAARKRKSREDKLAAVMEGRTDRSQFGHKRKKSETGTLTNREKSHTKNFMMHRHKRAISGKMMRSQNDKQNAKTNASKGKYKKNKKCGRR